MKTWLLLPFALATLTLAGCSDDEPAQKAKKITVTVTGETPVVVVVGDEGRINVTRSDPSEEFEADAHRIYRPSQQDDDDLAETSSVQEPLILHWPTASASSETAPATGSVVTAPSDACSEKAATDEPAFGPKSYSNGIGAGPNNLTHSPETR